MAKNKGAVSSSINIAARLLIVCLAVAALVALVFTVTKNPIAEGEKQRKEDSIRMLFADAASFEAIPLKADGVNEAFRVENAEGAVIGFCVDYTGTSEYGGDVNMMIAVTPNGKVSGVKIISHSETYMDRYTDDNGFYTGVSKPYGADVSSGATLSYRAIRNAILAVEEICATNGFLSAPAPEAPPAEGEEQPETPEEPAPETVLYEAEMRQFFANGASFLRQNNKEGGGVEAVYDVRDAEERALGYCVVYLSAQGYRGNIKLLMACEPTGGVSAVRVLENYDEHMGFYTDENGLYDLDTTASASSQTYHAVENAIAAVEALSLGGAV